MATVGDSKNSPIDHYGDSWLGDLSPNISRYLYKGKRQFQEVLYIEYDRLQRGDDASEWLLFEIDEETFSRDFLNAKDTQTSTPWSSFSAIENLLLVRMTMTHEHSAALGAFGNALIQALVPMGLGMALQPYPGATIEGEKKGKQGDNGWGPVRPPCEHDRKWPTVVLEVAISESQSKLQSDVRFWLRESQGKVSIVFTLTVDRRNPKIVIEKWESAGDRGEHRTQHVTVYQGANNRLYITGAPLVIEFPKLFVRGTNLPREGDIKFSEDVLEKLAVTIWLAQGFEV